MNLKNKIVSLLNDALLPITNQYEVQDYIVRIAHQGLVSLSPDFVVIAQSGNAFKSSPFYQGYGSFPIGKQYRVNSVSNGSGYMGIVGYNVSKYIGCRLFCKLSIPLGQIWIVNSADNTCDNAGKNIYMNSSSEHTGHMDIEYPYI